jgi:hypothetical protein
MIIGILILALWASMVGLATYQRVRQRRAEKTCTNRTPYWRGGPCGTLDDWSLLDHGFFYDPRQLCLEHERSQKVLWWERWPRRVATFLVAIHAIRVFDPFGLGFGPAGPVADRWGFVALGLFAVFFTYKAVHGWVTKLAPTSTAK